MMDIQSTLRGKIGHSLDDIVGVHESPLGKWAMDPFKRQDYVLSKGTKDPPPPPQIFFST